ncbi:MAG: glucosidase [Planctomycetota bacterium]
MPANSTTPANAERARLDDDTRRRANWKRWGPYLADRQWGTVREDYSADGDAWGSFPHEHARSRVYRWGEDGLLGFSDRQGRMCLSVALWNGVDPILKERLFGLTGPEGNHGEDVKECYWHLDGTPTHSWMSALYRYPQRAFPYEELVRENARRGLQDLEYELTDTGVFAEDRFFDVTVEYAKASPDDVLVRWRIENHGPEAATIHVLPTLWFRNTWSWGRSGEEHGPKPTIVRRDARTVAASHDTLGDYCAAFDDASDGTAPTLLFTENESNLKRLYGAENVAAHVKDAFHAYIVAGDTSAVAPDGRGTKVAAHYVLHVPAGGAREVRARLSAGQRAPRLGADFEAVCAARQLEAHEFHAQLAHPKLTPDERVVARRAYAGLLWTKQFYHYVVPHWLDGDPLQPPPPRERLHGRNIEWDHLYNRDVLSMPDKWEYPWYAAWDLAFHMIPFARIDATFAKQQLALLLREWYMHPNGQIPAYEWNFGDVNPPVHAWAVWRVYKITGPPGQRDQLFLKSCFQKLLLNFTWWVNRKDAHGRHLFSGGFLGLDNIGVFDRGAPLPGGGSLEQADGTAWMAFYCGTMLSIALELARFDSSYEDLASKFLEHFIAIADAMNHLDGTGLWDEEDGFYYDHILVQGRSVPLKLRSAVGVIPLLAVEVLEQSAIDALPGFERRMRWFLENRTDVCYRMGYMEDDEGHEHRLLAIPSRERLIQVLRYVLDEKELLSSFGVRSLSKAHASRPFELTLAGQRFSARYAPGESDSRMFGGNSNWRGPIWMPINFLLVEALERYHHFYGDTLRVECPTGSGVLMNLGEVSRELARRLVQPWSKGPEGRRPFHGDGRVAGGEPLAEHPHWRDQLLFHEYFHGDNGRGLGAGHQTGWTALVATLIDARARGGTRQRHWGPSTNEKA